MCASQHAPMLIGQQVGALRKVVIQELKLGDRQAGDRNKIARQRIELLLSLLRVLGILLLLTQLLAKPAGKMLCGFGLGLGLVRCWRVWRCRFSARQWQLTNRFIYPQARASVPPKADVGARPRNVCFTRPRAQCFPIPWARQVLRLRVRVLDPRQCLLIEFYLKLEYLDL